MEKIIARVDLFKLALLWVCIFAAIIITASMINHWTYLSTSVIWSMGGMMLILLLLATDILCFRTEKEIEIYVRDKRAIKNVCNHLDEIEKRTKEIGK